MLEVLNFFPFFSSFLLISSTFTNQTSTLLRLLEFLDTLLCDWIALTPSLALSFDDSGASGGVVIFARLILF